MQVVHAHILSTVFLHEKLHWYSLVGSVLIGLGVMLVQSNKPAPAKMAPTEAELTSDKRLPSGALAVRMPSLEMTSVAKSPSIVNSATSIQGREEPDVLSRDSHPRLSIEF